MGSELPPRRRIPWPPQNKTTFIGADCTRGAAAGQRPRAGVLSSPSMNFTRSRDMQERLQRLVPGGAHTYAKGADQYPQLSPAVIARGSGCHVWDVDGNEF